LPERTSSHRKSICGLGRVVPFLPLARQDMRHLRLIHLVHQLLERQQAHHATDEAGRVEPLRRVLHTPRLSAVAWLWMRARRRCGLVTAPDRSSDFGVSSAIGPSKDSPAVNNAQMYTDRPVFYRTLAGRRVAIHNPNRLLDIRLSPGQSDPNRSIVRRVVDQSDGRDRTPVPRPELGRQNQNSG